MGTRALQFECLLTPVIDSSDGSVAVGYSVEFYSAGTSNAKNVWTEKEKTNPFTTVTLDSDGTSSVYGDGIYDIIIKNLSDEQVYEWPDVKVQANTYTVQNKSGAYTVTPDDDLIIVDTSGGDVPIALESVDTFERPVTIKNVGGGIGNEVPITPEGDETIDGDSTYTLSGDKQSIDLYPDTGSSIWRRDTNEDDFSNIHIGDIKRSQFTYVDGDTITVGGGSYDVSGTLARITSAITTTAHGITGADWAYLYIDYSSIPGTGILVQSDLIWSTTEPTWSHTLLGWYNGDDRCIFACRIAVTTDAIVIFRHARDLIKFDTPIATVIGDNAPQDWTDISAAFTMPVFSRMAETIFYAYYVDATGGLYWRTNGSASTDGELIGIVTVNSQRAVAAASAITDSGHLIEVKDGVVSTNTYGITQSGWYFPEGM